MRVWVGSGRAGSGILADPQKFMDKILKFKGADHSTGIVEIRGNAGIGIRGIRIFQYLNQCPELHDEEGNIIPLSERFSGAAPLFRGDGFYIKFEGLQRIYAS
jgi:hypothetical protein